MPGTEWTDSARRLVDALRTAAGSPPGAAAPGSDCRWCPLCQAAAVVRGERPEVSGALADLLSTTSAALRSFAGEPVPGTGTAAGPVRGAEHAVQRIDLT